MSINYFWDENAMKQSASPNPSILAIGDSWFWYPFPGGSLVNNLGELVKPKGHVIFTKGMNGAEAFDYVDGKYARSVREALRLYGSGLEAVFISGGGNDFAGFNDLRPLLKPDCSAENAAAGCFRGGARGLKEFLDRVDTYYRKLIGVIYTRTSQDCRIVMHSYDYPIPDGRGVFGDAGWLQPALADAKVPRKLHAECMVHLVDSFHKVLTTIQKTDPEHLIVVDSRGSLNNSEWHNELHPTAAGFAKITAKCWQPALQQAGLL